MTPSELRSAAKYSQRSLPRVEEHLAPDAAVEQIIRLARLRERHDALYQRSLGADGREDVASTCCVRSAHVGSRKLSVPPKEQVRRERHKRAHGTAPEGERDVLVVQRTARERHVPTVIVHACERVEAGGVEEGVSTYRQR